MTIGQRLKKWRLSKKLTQRKAAEAAGVSQAAWQVVESDQSTEHLGVGVADKISRSTGGAIRFEDFRPRWTRVASTARTGTDG